MKREMIISFEMKTGYKCVWVFLEQVLVNTR